MKSLGGMSAMRLLPGIGDRALTANGLQMTDEQRLAHRKQTNEKREIFYIN